MKFNKNTISCFLPCRKGSQRVKNKNTRQFANLDNGLIEIKIKQLVKSDRIDQIIVSTDDEKVKETSKKIASEVEKPIYIIDRPSHLASSSTTTDSLIEHVPSIIHEGIVLWTHVTSPFVDEKIYDLALENYLNNTSSKTHDSLMAVTKLQNFIWNQSGPVNYQRSPIKWPQTQTLDILFEINSAFFIADISIYRLNNDRIGIKPALFELAHPYSIDIDSLDQFYEAQHTWEIFQKNNSLT